MFVGIPNKRTRPVRYLSDRSINTMDSPTNPTLKLLEARVIELKRQHKEDTEDFNAIIAMKANYMKFKIDSLLALITQMRKSG